MAAQPTKGNTRMNAPDLDRIYIYVNHNRVSVAAFLAMDKESVRTVDAAGCTALTTLDAPQATRVHANGCTALTTLDAPQATRVHAIGCTALTGYFCAGKDSRGYSFYTMRWHGGFRVFAGCRNFTLAQARKHYGPGGVSDRADCLALVEKIAAHVEASATP